MTSEPEIQKACDAIKCGDVSAESLALIAKLIDEDKGQSLLVELLGFSEVLNGGEEYFESVDKVDSTLTALHDKAKFPSLVLMAYLWPFANNTYIGHVWDSIGIYLGEGMSDQLRNELKKIAGRTTDESMRNIYLEWITLPSRA